MPRPTRWPAPTLFPYDQRRMALDGHEIAYRAPFPTPAARLPTYVFPREIVAARAYLAGVEARLDALRELPVLILWGDRDIAFRARERREFETRFPHHRTVVLDGAAHFVQEDAAAEIVAAVRDWAGASPRRGAPHPAAP